MNRDHLLDRLSQAQTLSDLDHLLDSTTMVGILNSWLFDCQGKNYSKKTLDHYHGKVSEFIEFIGTDTDPNQITSNHIRLFLTVKKRNPKNPEKPRKPWTIHGYHRAIHTFFSYMKQQRIIKEHPMADMKPPKIPEYIIQPYSKEQVAVLLDACDSSTFLGSRNKALILLFISTGLRKQEMSEIELKDVNITQQSIKVMGKGAKGRIVGFGTQASKALMVYFIQRKSRVKPGYEEWLWLSEEGTRLQYSGIGEAIDDLVKAVGLTEIHSRIHALRHSFATESLRNGAGLNEVQALMGHSTSDMTLKYAKTVNSYDAVKQHPKFDPVDHWKL